MLIRWFALPALLVGAVAGRASASVIRCWGQMRDASCAPMTQVWPSDSHPTFGVACEACWTAPDGGVCMMLPTSPEQLRLEVAGKTYNRAFERLRLCGEEELFRFTGPLEPGQRHEIIYPGNVDYSRPKRFTVDFLVAPVPPPPPPDANPAPGPSVPGPRDDAALPVDTSLAPTAERSRGCSMAGRSDFPWLLAAAATMLHRRRRRTGR